MVTRNFCNLKNKNEKIEIKTTFIVLVSTINQTSTLNVTINEYS